MVAPALIAAIPAAMKLATSVMEGFSSKKQNEAYEKYQELSRQAALEQYRYQTRAINNRLAEEAQSTALAQEQNMLQNLRSKATAQASAASSGITGSTIDNLFKDYDRANALSNYVASKNLYLKGLQATDEKEAAYIQALNAINTQHYQKAPSMGLSLLSGLGSFASTYVNNRYNTNKYIYSNKGQISNNLSLALDGGNL